MCMNKRLWLPHLLMVCLFVSISGCALKMHRTHPDFDARIGTVKNAILVPPDVNMFELSPAGIVTPRDDWSAAGSRNLKNAISQDLKDKNRYLKPLVMDRQIAAELAEIVALYRLVHKTMQQQTFHPHQIPKDKHGFEYSLGSLEPILEKFGADAMIFVSGYDRVSNPGRKAFIDLAIADSSGTILYYSVKGSMRGNDLRDPASATSMVQELLSSFSRTEG
jgi:hypothetical protein